MPVPEVSVRKSERKPIRPRDGTEASIRVRPLPSRIAHLLHHGALMLIFDIEDYIFKRLHLYAINFFHDDFRTGDAHFKAFTAHAFNEHGQMQLTTAGYLEAIR